MNPNNEILAPEDPTTKRYRGQGNLHYVKRQGESLLYPNGPKYGYFVVLQDLKGGHEELIFTEEEISMARDRSAWVDYNTPEPKTFWQIFFSGEWWRWF